MILFLAYAVLQTSYPCIGLAANPVVGTGEAAFLASVRREMRLGLDGGTMTLKWDEVATQGLKSVSDGVGLANLTGQKELLTIATIDTVKKRLPADLADLQWDDPVLEKRFDDLLGQVAPIVAGKISWISLGNEVNPYLTAHAEELQPYLRFLAHERDTVHRLLPKVQVGVTITCMDSTLQSYIPKALQQGMDVTIFTYYPLDPQFKVIVPLQTKQHFDAMLDIAGDRPLLLQEIGCPTSDASGGSEAIQADFVNQVFDQMDAHAGKIGLGVFFMENDFSADQLKLWTAYYGIGAPSFIGYLATLGLCDGTGKPKAAWPAFIAACEKRKPIQ